MDDTLISKPSLYSLSGLFSSMWNARQTRSHQSVVDGMDKTKRSDGMLQRTPPKRSAMSKTAFRDATETAHEEDSRDCSTDSLDGKSEAINRWVQQTNHDLIFPQQVQHQQAIRQKQQHSEPAPHLPCSSTSTASSRRTESVTSHSRYSVSDGRPTDSSETTLESITITTPPAFPPPSSASLSNRLEPAPAKAETHAYVSPHDPDARLNGACREVDGSTPRPSSVSSRTDEEPARTTTTVEAPLPSPTTLPSSVGPKSSTPSATTTPGRPRILRKTASQHTLRSTARPVLFTDAMREPTPSVPIVFTNTQIEASLPSGPRPEVVDTSGFHVPSAQHEPSKPHQSRPTLKAKQSLESILAKKHLQDCQTPAPPAVPAVPAEHGRLTCSTSQPRGSFASHPKVEDRPKHSTAALCEAGSAGTSHPSSPNEPTKVVPSLRTAKSTPTLRRKSSTDTVIFTPKQRRVHVKRSEPGVLDSCKAFFGWSDGTTSTGTHKQYSSRSSSRDPSSSTSQSRSPSGQKRRKSKKLPRHGHPADHNVSSEDERFSPVRRSSNTLTVANGATLTRRFSWSSAPSTPLVLPTIIISEASSNEGDSDDDGYYQRLGSRPST